MKEATDWYLRNTDVKCEHLKWGWCTPVIPGQQEAEAGRLWV